ncbi:MAG: alanyl-tRNA editing protein [Candidatus Thorarchaeota archaeon]
MTELLHMRDNYLREFDATVKQVGANYVVLDRTAFYPEGGGQVGDRGELLSERLRAVVIDTKKAEGTVRHIIADENRFSPGMAVHGSLDWSWRYQCMRYHTAQHVLSRLLQLTFGLETVGNHVAPGESRADFSPVNDISDVMRKEIEDGVNEIFSEGLPVEIRFMPREEATTFLHEMGYQTRYLEMVPKEVSEFRVVQIGNWDASSCAGTHVANTREVGRLSILRTKNVGAQKQRIYFTLYE